MWRGWFGWELRHCGCSIEFGEGERGALGGEGKKKPRPERRRVRHTAAL